MKASGISAAPPFGRRWGAGVWLLPCFPDMKPPPPFYNHLLSSVFIRLHASVVSASLSRLLIIISVCARLYLILAPLLTLLVSALHELRCLPQTPQIREGFFFLFSHAETDYILPWAAYDVDNTRGFNGHTVNNLDTDIEEISWILIVTSIGTLKVIISKAVWFHQPGAIPKHIMTHNSE